MNKLFRYSIPLLSISFLISCNPNGGKDKEEDYSIKATCLSNEIKEYSKSLQSFPSSLQIAYDNISNFELELIKHKDKAYSIDTISSFRQESYSGYQWSIVAGSTSSTVKDLFSNYKQSKSDKWIKVGNNYIDNLNKEIDYYHMHAVLNTYMYSTSNTNRDLASFGGDICQTVNEIRGIEDPIQQLEAAKNSPNFSNYDLYADVDGANIYRIYKDKTYYKNIDSISSAFAYYYITLNSDSSRFNSYYSSNFDSSLTEDEQVNEIYKRLKNNAYINIWCDKQSPKIDFDVDKNIILVSIRAFVQRITDKII